MCWLQLKTMFAMDASDFALFGVSQQPDTPSLFTLAHFALQNINYNVHDKELLAVESFCDKRVAA
jgi:hypothetical protein